MPILPSILALFLILSGQSAHAGRVNWPHFLKINPWTFEPDEVRHPNHSNIDPSVIDELIGLGDPGLTPSGRMLRAGQAISELPKLVPEQRAVLVRDALDAIHDRQPKWKAHDAAAANGVIFYGGELETKEHFALAVSLRTGQIYKGRITCAALMETSNLADFATSPSWKPIVASSSQKP